MPNYWLSTAPTSASLDVSEVGDSRSENFVLGEGLTASVTLQCPWENRLLVADDLLSNVVPYAPYPTLGARATGVAIRGFSGTVADGELCVYELAHLDVSYTQGASPHESGPIISEALEPHAEFITLPPEKFLWGSADVFAGVKLKDEEAPGKIVRGFDYIQTRYNLVSIPVEVLTPNIVNASPVTASLLGLTFAPETLLYVDSQPHRTITIGGANRYTMTSRFSYRQWGWNRFYRAATETWEQMYVANSSEGPGFVYNNFPTGSFSAILV
jgi:hypothetical protein